MLEAIRVSTVIPASAERIYQAWLDSAEHSAFTGGPAEVDPKIGGRFTAWDGYIEGVTLELEPGRRIVQSWRSSDFPNDADDSRLEVILDETQVFGRSVLDDRERLHRARAAALAAASSMDLRKSSGDTVSAPIVRPLKNASIAGPSSASATRRSADSRSSTTRGGATKKSPVTRTWPMRSRAGPSRRR